MFSWCFNKEQLGAQFFANVEYRVRLATSRALRLRMFVEDIRERQ